MTIPPEQQSTSETHNRADAWKKKHTYIIAAMVALTISTILYRNTIRAQWWVWQLSDPTSIISPNRELIERKLASLGPIVIIPTIKLSIHPDETVRLSAIHIWRNCNASFDHQPEPNRSAESQSVETVNLIAAMTHDTSNNVRHAAIKTLGQYECEPSIQHLNNTIHGTNQYDGMLAAAQMSRFQQPLAHQTLSRALKTNISVGIKIQIIECIQQNRDHRFMPELISCITDNSTFIGPTLNQIHAQQVFSMTTNDIKKIYKNQNVSQIDMNDHHVVSAYAAETLTLLTGHKIDYQMDDPESRHWASKKWAEFLNIEIIP